MQNRIASLPTALWPNCFHRSDLISYGVLDPGMAMVVFDQKPLPSLKTWMGWE